MKNYSTLLGIGLAILVSGCATVKTPMPDTGNKDEGRVNLTYQYGLFEKPQVNWDQALLAATDQCKKWQYGPASQSTTPADECVRRDQNNNCIQHQVTTSYQCQFSADQLKTKEEDRKKAVAAEQEKQAQFAKDYPYTATLICGDNNSHWNIYVCFQGDHGVDTSLEIRNGTQYGLYKAHELENAGKETPQGFVIPLKNNFSIVAQNISDTAKLTLIIKNNTTGQTTFTKSVLQFGKISVKN
jgi:hypothetical protein